MCFLLMLLNSDDFWTVLEWIVTKKEVKNEKIILVTVDSTFGCM